MDGDVSLHRQCLREPIPEIFDAARYLDAAVSAHLAGHRDLADQLIRLADMPPIREWTESIWGAQSPHVQLRPQIDAPPHLPADQRTKLRMPTLAEKRQLHVRDGYHCRVCSIPVIRQEVRQRLRDAYPSAVQWEGRNAEQHAAFQAMWVQYDHVIPHARGGTNDADNMLITCAPCNYGRMNYTFAEVGLTDPRTRHPIQSTWDGLERLMQSRDLS
ncbi:HNH endonuclease [Ralstonia mojiangensis]|uniref:HNH endonuclease n=1 Tax=Ralstonia mojiangensis TaxID=2953895 RepID=UPI0020901466|nr:HNH endonuclease [Ralstonia mojiangensis]MCO5411113.1 HNH endonuclease [Ralstonia mojiangensis]